jgi:hypothetical protein
MGLARFINQYHAAPRALSHGNCLARRPFDLILTSIRPAKCRAATLPAIDNSACILPSFPTCSHQIAAL